MGRGAVAVGMRNTGFTSTTRVTEVIALLEAVGYEHKLTKTSTTLSSTDSMDDYLEV